MRAVRHNELSSVPGHSAAPHVAHCRFENVQSLFPIFPFLLDDENYPSEMLIVELAGKMTNRSVRHPPGRPDGL